MEEEYNEEISINNRIANFLESLTLLKDRVSIKKKDLDLVTIGEWIEWLRSN